MALRYGARTRPGTMVSTWLNSLVSGTAPSGDGYFGGGTPGTMTTVDKFAFSDDSRTTLGTGLATATRALCGFANSGVAGYFAGGAAPSETATVDKFAFSDDSRSTLGTGLSSARKSPGGFANSGTAGYVGGGERPGPAYNTDAIDKFAFSDDSRTTLSAVLTTTTTYLAGMANSGTAGYFGGGDGSLLSTVDKIAFSDDSRSTLGTGLSAARRGLAGMANSGTAGYFGGGNASGTVVDKFAFSDDSRTTLAAGLAEATYDPAGFANSGTAGYIGGGYGEGGTGYATYVFKWAFSDDSRTTLGTGLSVARGQLGGMATNVSL